MDFKIYIQLQIRHVCLPIWHISMRSLDLKWLMFLHNMKLNWYVMHWPLTLQVYPPSERPGWPKETHTWLCTGNWTWLWKRDTNTNICTKPHRHLCTVNESTLTHEHAHINHKQQNHRILVSSPKCHRKFLKMCVCVRVRTDVSTTSPPMFCSVMAIPAAIFPGVPKAL